MRFPSARTLALAVRELGLRAILEYGWYQIELRSGLLRRRTRPFRWEERPLRSWLRDETRGERVLPLRERFLFRPEAELTAELAGFQAGSPRKDAEEADEILAGRWRLFGGPPIQLGFPPDWGRVPMTEDSPQVVPLNRHWTQYQLDGEVDYRSLWEPARFGWCFVLGRAYRLTGEVRYREGFFSLLDSWLASNPPNLGPHWASGQEVALRLIGLIFGFFVFAPLTPEREEQMPTAGKLSAGAGWSLPWRIKFSPMGDTSNIRPTTSAWPWPLGCGRPAWQSCTMSRCRRGLSWRWVG